MTDPRKILDFDTPYSDSESERADRRARGMWPKICLAYQGDTEPCATPCLHCSRIAGAVGGEIADLQTALSRSVELQSHYAGLLNMHDGGKRIQFTSRDAWMDRLREIGTLPRAGSKADDPQQRARDDVAVGRPNSGFKSRDGGQS